MEGEPPAPTRWAHAFAAPADQVAAAAYTHLNFMRFRSCHDAAAAAAGARCGRVLRGSCADPRRFVFCRRGVRGGARLRVAHVVLRRQRGGAGKAAVVRAPGVEHA
jgi:hypothetical protein